MVKNKKLFTIVTIIVILCIMMIGMSLVYASVTSKLNIFGHASMDTSRWNVHFQNLSEPYFDGKTEEISRPVFYKNSTTLSNINICFANVNDAVRYTFEVTNDGDIDAKISSIIKLKPICTGTGTNSYEDSNFVCNNLNYTLTYSDGKEIKDGDILYKGQTKLLELKLEYLGSHLPKDIVKVSEINITLVYIQK